jgi:predicted MPP superfamily phosphohydrolase
MAVIYLVLLLAPQVLLFLYLWGRLPDPERPQGTRWIHVALTVVFAAFDFPWLFVARRVLFGSVWGAGTIPMLAPWLAWQLLGWLFGAFVTVYVIGKGVVWLVARLRKGSGERGVVRDGPAPISDSHRGRPLPTPHSLVSRRRFLARATYAYAGTGLALTGYGIASAKQIPSVTRRVLTFPSLPAPFDGLTILHVSDVHAGMYMERDQMQEIVARANAQRADLVLQTGDMIDFSPAYIPEYVAAFRDLSASLGVITCLGNHDLYTGAARVIKGVREAGQIVVRGDVHLIERDGSTLAIAGIDDPDNWQFDDPQTLAVGRTLHDVPRDAFTILLAHRPGAFDTARRHDVPLTLSGHIHGGQIAIPMVGWSAGQLITKYVAGHFASGPSQLYVSRGIGVVGVPIRVFAPPELALFELRRGA